MATTMGTLSTLVQLCQQWSLGSPMRKGPIFVWHTALYSKGASWHMIPSGMRWSGSPPMGLPMILAGWKTEWQSHWRILCPMPAKRWIASQSSESIAWPGLMPPLWKRRVRRCRRRMMHMSRCRRGMSMYPRPSWRITSAGRWRDEGNQTPKYHLAMRCTVRVRLNQRWSHKDDHRSGHP